MQTSDLTTFLKIHHVILKALHNRLRLDMKIFLSRYFSPKNGPLIGQPARLANQRLVFRWEIA